jgi:ribonucleotide monophosphatase NagD (HAD superfamily)
VEKLYLVYMSNYEEVVRSGADATEILGLYKDKFMAYKVAKEQINKVLDEHDWVLDLERDNIDRDGYVRLFYGHQENWDDYFEISVTELEVQESGI